MNRILHISTLSVCFFLAACGAENESKDNAALEEKKEKLESLKKQQIEISAEVTKLEQEIIALDPSARPQKAKLVAVSTIDPQNFDHFIDLQGSVEAENVAYVSPRAGGGQVKGVYVKQGDNIRKGQLLLKLDDAIIRSQIEQAKTQLAYAKDLYNRRNNLWKEKIGTEVELISAKNNVDQAQNQLNLLQEQLAFSNVYAEMSGVAEEVTIRMGEFFTGNPMQGGYIKIVNTNNLKVKVQVPENYIGRVKPGGKMEVTLPDINKTIIVSISNTGKIIDPNNRSFYVEGRLPSSADFKPNQVAVVKILDYSATNAISIPINILQKDEKGSFVMIAQNENGKMIARKKMVEYGELYGNNLEIKSGLNPGDLIITEGFQNLYDGELISTQVS